MSEGVFTSALKCSFVQEALFGHPCSTFSVILYEIYLAHEQKLLKLFYFLHLARLTNSPRFKSLKQMPRE